MGNAVKYGDVIDTLAEDIHGYVAVDEAIATVTRIMDDNRSPGYETRSRIL